MSQPRISEIERPGERNLNLETLFRLAEAYDIALQVRFVPFSEYVDWTDNIDLSNFFVKPFEQDMAETESDEQWAKAKEALKDSPQQTPAALRRSGSTAFEAFNTGLRLIPKLPLSSAPEQSAPSWERALCS